MKSPLNTPLHKFGMSSEGNLQYTHGKLRRYENDNFFHTVKTMGIHDKTSSRR